MESPRSSGSVRRHARNISHPTPQRAARGPLEAATDDTPQTPEPVALHRAPPNIDLRFLQDRHIYHSVTTEDVPSPFLNSTHRPPVDTPLPHLIQHGHFRRAAELALRSLLQSPPTAAAQIFQLLYTRLACLVLVSRPDVAAAEAIPLFELASRSAPGSQQVVEFIPWHLRLLLVRLQTIGAADGGRRGIMALYALASEVRANIRSAHQDGNASTIELWEGRLRDLGLRVCDALVEMGELESAVRHLDTLPDVDADELAFRKAILRTRVGDVATARQCGSAIQDDMKRREIEALLKVADGDHDEAIVSWQSLVEDFPDREHFALNAAVSLLYVGQIESARSMLESLTRDIPAFPTILFNLSTVYELCTERAPEKKASLTQQAATRQPVPASGGWERATFEFKL
ncbi:hypothetical protein CERZMDRAFT_113117 [Cercospora zeae-maydis SCOH1-5]|uniref:Tetratricopeptide repeat protein 15 n=1 Tax=Cercospora zeae-maydis SCOH1-5 TaxID=717836 RepID=A0A6A6FAS6_9PEZI|nr:hypothetical protein CERZMDRAFT_113117 [Cercospora zeae-maydis SCOH1-5]